MLARRLLGLAAFGAMTACGTQQTVSPLDLDAQQLDALREWPTIASVPAPAQATGAVPPLPPLPPLVPGNETRLVERLEALVRSHPDAATRETLTVALDLGNLKVELAPLGQRAAVFGNVISARGAQATLAVDPRVLSQNFDASPVVTLRVWLMLTHETRHFLQWQATSGPERETFDVGADGSVETTTRQACVWLWAHEREAYQAECASAYAWGHPELAERPLCDNPADTVPFNQHLLVVMLGSNGESDACASTWASLAGHPHPEAFGVLRPRSP